MWHSSLPDLYNFRQPKSIHCSNKPRDENHTQIDIL